MKTRDVAAFLSASVEGDGDLELTGIADLETAGAADLSFVKGDASQATRAGALIVSDSSVIPPPARAVIRVPDPKLAFAQAASLFARDAARRGVHETAAISGRAQVAASHVGAHVSIDDDTEIGSECEIHAGVRIGRRVSIGSSTVIHPNVTIHDGATVGSNCVIQAGTVLGSAGFGYVTDRDGSHLRFPQVGSVIIEDWVEIGANCTIDGGSLGTTRIGRGTKIDNLVHIAHNVRIGERVLIAGQSGIAGSSVIGDGVVIAGQVGISDHVTIREGCIIGAKSAVYPNKVIRRGFWAGNPARPLEQFLKDAAGRREIERLKREVEALRERFDMQET